MFQNKESCSQLSNTNLVGRTKIHSVYYRNKRESKVSKFLDDFYDLNIHVYFLKNLPVWFLTNFAL